MDPETVRNQRFLLVRRGYDPEAVEEFLDDVASALEDLRAAAEVDAPGPRELEVDEARRAVDDARTRAATHRLRAQRDVEALERAARQRRARLLAEIEELAAARDQLSTDLDRAVDVVDRVVQWVRRTDPGATGTPAPDAVGGATPSVAPAPDGAAVPGETVSGDTDTGDREVDAKKDANDDGVAARDDVEDPDAAPGDDEVDSPDDEVGPSDGEVGPSDGEEVASPHDDGVEATVHEEADPSDDGAVDASDDGEVEASDDEAVETSHDEDDEVDEVDEVDTRNDRVAAGDDVEDPDGAPGGAPDSPEVVAAALPDDAAVIVGDEPGVAAVRDALRAVQDEVLANLRQHPRGDVADWLPSATGLEALDDAATDAAGDAFLAGWEFAAPPDAEVPDDDHAIARDALEEVRGAGDLPRLDVAADLEVALQASLARGRGAGDPEVALRERVAEVHRDLRQTRLPQAIEAVLVAARHHGQVARWRRDGVEAVAWVVGRERRCPGRRCRGNADDGVVAPGAAFAFGDVVPPAHPGCTCTLRPAGRDEASA